MSSKLKIIMIDNYDSFTYNLVDQFYQLGADVLVYRNDTPIDSIFTSQVTAHTNTVIVISPGPGNPDSAGFSLDIIQRFTGKLPILGICLGHQAIVQFFGGKIGSAQQIVHGKADDIIVENTSSSVFTNLPTPFKAARYHSLAASAIPDALEVIAKSQYEVMAVQHKQHKILGFQFHPESILTTFGATLLSNAVDWLTESKQNDLLNH